MRASRFVFTAAISLVLSGCVPASNEPMFSSRGGGVTKISTMNATNEAHLQAQTAALGNMTRDIIRKSTMKGAAIGAVAGCGLVLLSASNAKNCVTGALTGGAVGAIAGAASGKKQAAKRIELVSPSALVRSISKADDRMDVVSRDLPGLLAQQDSELQLLNGKMKNGEITQAQYTHRYEVIKANRAQLAEALSLSAAQANEAHNNLQNAKAQGQTGLEWHLHSTKKLAREATSARSAISLL